MIDPGTPCLVTDRHPYLERILRRDVVESKRRKKADDAGRDAASGFGQVLPLIARFPRERVETTSQPFDLATLDKALKLSPAHSGAFQLSRPDDASCGNELPDSTERLVFRYVSSAIDHSCREFAT